MVKNLEFSESARKSKLNDFEFVRRTVFFALFFFPLLLWLASEPGVKV